MWAHYVPLVDPASGKDQPGFSSCRPESRRGYDTAGAMVTTNVPVRLARRHIRGAVLSGDWSWAAQPGSTRPARSLDQPLGAA